MLTDAALLLAVNASVLMAFLLGRRLSAIAAHPPMLSPVMVAATLVLAGCWIAKLDVARFETLTWPLRWALGPAIVALGAVVHAARVSLRAQLGKLLVAVAGGTAVGLVMAVGLARLSGLDTVITTALITKTVSTPFAVLIQTRAGGPVAMAAAFAVLTGVIGAIVVPLALKAARLQGSATWGIAIGVSSHLVGTDWLSRRDPRGAAFAGGATVIAGALAAALLPFVWSWLAAAG